MIFEKFVDTSKDIINLYLKNVSSLYRKGLINTNGKEIIFPNILLASKCKGYFVIELFGAAPTHNGLTAKRSKEQSITRYFNQFNDNCENPFMVHGGKCSGISNLCLASESDLDKVTDRFPSIDLHGSKLIGSGEFDSLFSFNEGFSSCWITNSGLVNRHNNVYRCKNIIAAFIFTKTVTNNDIKELFNTFLGGDEVKLVQLLENEKHRKLLLAGQLQNMYLINGLHETTLGDFISKHPEIIHQAFNTKNFQYEPNLEWIEKPPNCDDNFINPDLMIQRDDGFFDIYDLKTAAISKKSLTKGKRNRRRFIDYVEEGVAQLANYREYFEFEENLKHAEQKYGITVHNPKLVLVVGSWENSTASDIQEATRRYPEVEIIDYDTLCQLYVS